MINGITYILLATLFYTATPDIKENLYSWQLNFSSYEKCTTFFDQFGDKLLNGVMDHAKKKYGKDVGVEYMSCAMVRVDPQALINGFTEPEILGQKVVYQQ
tara:strand:+ start:258 stop:560 length:303 start_codon:yes stop_codon:yes gene_type:complete